MPVYKKLEGELKKELNNLVVESVIYFVYVYYYP